MCAEQISRKQNSAVCAHKAEEKSSGKQAAAGLVETSSCVQEACFVPACPKGCGLHNEGGTAGSGISRTD